MTTSPGSPGSPGSVRLDRSTLTAYRRHTRTCPDRSKGQAYSLCSCPIWCSGLVPGGRVRQSLQTSDPEVARRRMDQLTSLSADDLRYLSTLSLTNATARFLQICRSRHLAPGTLENYAQTLAHLVKALGGDRRVNQITVTDIDAYRKARSIASSTWIKELIILRVFFGECVKREWCRDNPAKSVTMPASEELSTLPLDGETITRIFRACDTVECPIAARTPAFRVLARALVSVFLYSGLRISDVAVLRRDALAGNHLTLRVLKNGVRLKVRLSDSAVAALAALAALPTSTGSAGGADSRYFFFWNGRDLPKRCIRAIRHVIDRLSGVIGVHIHPHQFRDTFAVELLTKGADIRTVQQLLGHRSVRTTERHYAHFVAAHQQLLDEATSRLDFEGETGGPAPAAPAAPAGRG